MSALEEYTYDLPDELIARYPCAERTGSRLLRADCLRQTIQDGVFTDLSDCLEPGALLVLNDARVVPARFYATPGDSTGKQIECLFLRHAGGGLIEIMARPLRRLRPGRVLELSGSLYATVERRDAGRCLLRLRTRSAAHSDVSAAFDGWLEKHGEIPLPPYLGRLAEAIDATRYQTVYAAKGGAVAAPTAGLHFDQAFLSQLKNRGVEIATLNLQVGAGSFEPIRHARIEEHTMHEEVYTLSGDLIDKIHRARAQQRRVVAVGTTVVRALESAALNRSWNCEPQTTRLMIRPGFRCRVVDALLTNFHLPRSTLLVLVCALAGKEFLYRCYAHAIAQAYRFYSYGDAMYLALAPASGAGRVSYPPPQQDPRSGV